MKKITLFALTILFLTVLTINPLSKAFAMPFYHLKPQDLVVRSEFYTSYTTSSTERKNNIKLATSFINNTLLDIGEEFSFNEKVGPRIEKRGFMNAKIIIDGKFTEGVGGGVCQVSTTLYNAVLLADLKITEYHPHTLPVSYIAPSFDAMVSSGFADFKFVNNTNNPIIITASANESTVRFTILGEPKAREVLRESQILETLPVENEYIFDEKQEFPDLYEGEQKVLSYGKAGYISEGYLIYKRNGKIIGKKRIRKDTYKSTKNTIIKGVVKKTLTENEENI